MSYYLVYVQFNNENDGVAGYVAEWKPGYYPRVYSVDEAKYAQKCPSKQAAQAFLDRLCAEFESIKYGEIVGFGY